MGDVIPENDFDNLANVICQDMAKYCPQLYCDMEDSSSNEPPEAYASSILLNVNERFFLITAGHCVTGLKEMENMGFMLDYDFCIIRGSLKLINPHNSYYHDPNFEDLAIIELDGSTKEMLSEKYSFMPIEKISKAYSPLTRHRYLLFGYPTELTILDDVNKTITPKPIPIRTIEVDPVHYIKEKIDNRKILTFRGNQEEMIQSKTQAIPPPIAFGGISGCGLWRVLDLSISSPQYDLAGIVTGGTEAEIYATRTEVIASILEKHYNLTIY